MAFPEARTIDETLRAYLNGGTDRYVCLNNIRDWINRNLPGFELYLEDVWNEPIPGQTRFEYILRSKRTFNETEPLGYDIYQNHRDARHVWHLDDYIETVLLLDSPESIVDFILANQAC